MSTADSPRRAITLLQNGQHISIDEQTLRDLGGDLKGRNLMVTEDGEHGYDARQDCYSLLTSPEGHRIPNAGCLPMLNLRASHRDIDLSVEVSPAILRLPAPRNVAHLHFPHAAQFVHENERGVIQRCASIPPEEIIYDLALAYPDRRIVVLGKHIRQLDKLAARLSTKIADVQSVSATRPVVVIEDDPMPRIVCSTFTEAATVDFENSDMVLLLNACDCIQDRAKVALEAMEARFRLFGLVTKNQRAAPSEIDAMMAIFGPALVEVSGLWLSRREVHVAWIDNRDPRNNLGHEDPNFWSECYSRNDRRNRSLKQVAEGLSSGRMPQSRKFRSIASWFATRGKNQVSVTIFVQQLAHVIELAAMLPDWDIITGDIPLHGCPGSFRNRVKRQDRRWLTGERQIVLAEASRHFRGETSDVVIWAGGGLLSDAIPDRWLFADEGTNRPLLIVDFLDFHNATALKRSRVRERRYYDRNIFPPGISVSEGRAAMFLDQQRRR